MTLPWKICAPLWWGLAVRYFIYNNGPYVLLGFYGAFFHEPSIQDYFSQHKDIARHIEGGWAAFVSVIALKQSLQLHLPAIVRFVNSTASHS